MHLPPPIPGAPAVPASGSHRPGVSDGPGLTLVDPAGLTAALARALAGEAVVAPLPAEGRARWLAALEPQRPAGVEAGVVVATSGSTGAPKFVVLAADAVLTSAAATHERLGGPGDWVCLLPTHHVAGLMTVARAVAAGTSVRFGQGDLSDLPEPSERCYLSLVGAQLWRALAEPELMARLGRYAAVLLGGSAIDPGLLARARDGGIAVVTTYGMAETCGGCVYDGRPLRDVELGFDATGRISITAPLVFSGYRNDPAGTAAVLSGNTVLTRDRGRLAADGSLEVTGRIDDVVVSGGVNVDLAEAQRISDALVGAPEAGGVVLFAVDDERWGARVVAVTTGPLDLAQVTGVLGTRLGSAALPRELRRVARLAYTPSGKIDRIALQRDWQQGGSDGDAG
ncbi:MAG: AMP-binding protein [Propionicimonas sp.]|nr:AMP-binding protein [Propionicimonas sp.]